MDKKTVIDFWENCNLDVAHIGEKKGARAIKGFVQNVFDILEIEDIKKKQILAIGNKSLMEYGIGGEYIIEYLFRCFNLKKYVGFDISSRSIEYATKLLENKKYNFGLVYLKNMSIPDFNKYGKFDYFFCLATIQHFYSEKYFYEFFEKLNFANVLKIVLQIRHSDEIKFSNDYKTVEGALLSCLCNFDIISKILTNFKIKKTSDIMNKTKYQYAVYEKLT